MIIEVSYNKNVERVMNLKKMILQISTLCFCISIVIFALLDLPVGGIVGLSFLMFVIVTAVATSYLVKLYLPVKEETEEKLEPEQLEEEVFSDHVVSIDRREVKADIMIDPKDKKEKESKKADSEPETSEKE